MKKRQYIALTKFDPEDANKPIPKRWEPLPPEIKYKGQLAKKPRPFEELKGTPNLPSIFSGKPDPSCHQHRIKRQLLGDRKLKSPYTRQRLQQKRVIDEVQMDAFRKKNLALEARDLQDLARQVSLKGMETLLNILDDPDASPSVKVQAIGMIWERGYGKAAQTQVNINANADAKPSELDAQSLDRRIADALNRVEKLTNGKTEEGEGEDRPTHLRVYN